MALVLQPIGGSVGIGASQTAPAYTLDVGGDVNCSGAFRVNGTAIGAGGGYSGPSTYVSQPSRFVGNNYQNTHGVPCWVNVVMTVNGGGNANALIGATSGSVTATVAQCSNTDAATGGPYTLSFVLPTGWFAGIVTGGGGATIAAMDRVLLRTEISKP